MADEENIFNQARLDQDGLKKAGGLFHKEPRQEGIDLAGMANEMNALSRRIRIMEERYLNLRRKTQISDQNMLLNHKKAMNDLRILSDDMIEIKRDIADVKEKVKLVIKELQACAKKEDVEVLSKYINLWEPVNFMTRNEVECLMKERQMG